MKKQSDKNIPEGYFEGFYDRLKTRMEVDEMLSSFPRTEGFGVPEGYFDSLTDRIVERIQYHDRPVYRLRPYRWMAATAAVAAAVILIWKIGLQTDTPASDVSFGDLASVEVEEYLNVYYRADLANTGLAYSISWEDTSWDDTESVWSESEVSDTELYDYLNETLDYEETLNWSYETQ